MHVSSESTSQGSLSNHPAIHGFAAVCTEYYKKFASPHGARHIKAAGPSVFLETDGLSIYSRD
jgi:hypothetical protein